jgi:hypothetical protein
LKHHDEGEYIQNQAGSPSFISGISSMLAPLFKAAVAVAAVEVSGVLAVDMLLIKAYFGSAVQKKCQVRLT